MSESITTIPRRHPEVPLGIDPAVEFNLSENDKWQDPTDYDPDRVVSEEDRQHWAEATRADPEWWIQVDRDRAYWARYEEEIVQGYLLPRTRPDRVSDYDQPHYRGW